MSELTILYADDDEDDILLVKESFETDPRLKIIPFLSGEDLLHYVNSQDANAEKPCLIILDINMPKLNGREVFNALRSTPFADVPTVFFSTSSHVRDISFAKENGVGFITKPIDPQQMRRVADIFRSYCSGSFQFKN